MILSKSFLSDRQSIVKQVGCFFVFVLVSAKNQELATFSSHRIQNCITSGSVNEKNIYFQFASKYST
jgi:hypothetical protein